LRSRPGVIFAAADKRHRPRPREHHAHHQALVLQPAMADAALGEPNAWVTREGIAI
jgi:hypothetical protein